MSPSMDAGRRWASEIAVRLERSNFGIVCVTPDNLTAPWLFFEAGALAKKFDDSHLVPLLFGLGIGDIKQTPLGQFQAKIATTEADIWDVITSLNAALGEKRVPPEVLARSFGAFWPGLLAELSSEDLKSPPDNTTRPSEKVYEELLAVTQGVANAVDAQRIETAHLAEQIHALRLGANDRPRTIYDPPSGSNVDVGRLTISGSTFGPPFGVPGPTGSPIGATGPRGSDPRGK
jgi:hypothetical protein